MSQSSLMLIGSPETNQKQSTSSITHLIGKTKFPKFLKDRNQTIEIKTDNQKAPSVFIL